MEEEKVVRRRPVQLDPSPEDAYKKSKDELMKFVADQIEMMNSNLLFSGQSQPSFYSLNQSLMNFESVMLGLISIHAEVRSDLDYAKESYDNFYSSKYIEIKKEQAALGKSAQFTAQREIELYVRNRYLQELAEKKAEVIRIENQYNTINYLIDSWKNYSFILNQLGANSRAEAAAAGVALNNQKEFGDENLE
jgi:hypothetical protein